VAQRYMRAEGLMEWWKERLQKRQHEVVQ
jgi:hypothetical protein